MKPHEILKKLNRRKGNNESKQGQSYKPNNQLLIPNKSSKYKCSLFCPSKSQQRRRKCPKEEYNILDRNRHTIEAKEQNASFHSVME
ncbi:hypothetical protein [Romboutsia sp.]|uniref:hypothetical protein n=1 Tax=Romboutsia sp. TaxID=1965302 RepID=UPI002D80DDF2|nr:hypothetical protein [Romboutsia sp.]